MMKKVLLVLSIFLFSIILLPKVKAGTGYTFEEKIYKIEFDNLRSNKLKELLDGTDSLIVTIKVSVKSEVKTYKFMTLDVNKIEKQLLKKVINDMEDLNERAYVKLNGVKINEINIRCTSDSYNKILERKDNLDD